MRPIGVLLIAIGCLLVLPQLVVLAPDQRVVLAGIALGIAGGLLITDNPREGHRGHHR